MAQKLCDENLDIDGLETTSNSADSSNDIRYVDLAPYELKINEGIVGVYFNGKKNAPNGSASALKIKKTGTENKSVCYEDTDDDYDYDSSSSSSANEKRNDDALKIQHSRIHFAHLIKHVQNPEIFKATYDVIVDVGDTHFPSHSFILTSHSLYFARKLNQLKRKEEEQTRSESCGVGKDKDKIPRLVVPHHRVTCQIFSYIHHWLYNGQLPLEESNVIPIWTAVKLLKMKNAIRKCEIFVRRWLTTNNAMCVWETAALRHLPDLRVMAGEFLAHNFLSVVTCPEFLSYDFTQVLRLLSDKRIEISSEKDVLCAGLRWLSHSWKERSCYAEEILGCVRFACMTPSDFLECIYQHKDCEALRDLEYTINAIRKCI